MYRFEKSLFKLKYVYVKDYSEKQQQNQKLNEIWLTEKNFKLINTFKEQST